MKTYISQEEFEWFKRWLLEVEKIEPLPVCNEYELLRWKHKKPGEPMPICFKRYKTEKITLNTGATDYWRKYEQ